MADRFRRRSVETLASIAERRFENRRKRAARRPTSARRPPVDWKIQARDIGLNALLANGVELDQAYFDKTLAGARLASLINRRFRLRPTSRPRSRHE